MRSLYVVSYDVAHTDTPAGARRLRRVAKLCQNFGQRVQFSVFECTVTEKDWVRLRAGLLKAFDPRLDSLRFYHLGTAGQDRIEHHGAKKSIDFQEPLIL